MFKKLIVFMLVFVSLTVVLAGCSGSSNSDYQALLERIEELEGKVDELEGEVGATDIDALLARIAELEADAVITEQELAGLKAAKGLKEVSTAGEVFNFIQESEALYCKFTPFSYDFMIVVLQYDLLINNSYLHTYVVTNNASSFSLGLTPSVHPALSNAIAYKCL